MEQLVKVRQTYDDGTAEVYLVRQSACSGDCHKCSGCGTATEAMVFKATNSIGAGPGDMVKIESATGPVLKAAMVMYMVPMILFFVGYAIGDALWSLGGLVGGVFFAASIGLTVLYDRKVLKKKNIEYAITGFAGK